MPQPLGNDPGDEIGMMLFCTSELHIYIYIWSEIFRSQSEAKHGSQWRPNLRQSQSPYAVFHVYVYSKNCAGGLRPT